MLKLTLTLKDKVSIGSSLFTLLAIYDDCIYYSYRGIVEKLHVNQTSNVHNLIIKYIRHRKGRALIGLSSPEERIERIA